MLFRSLEIEEIPVSETENLLSEDDFPQDSFQVTGPDDGDGEPQMSQGDEAVDNSPTDVTAKKDKTPESEYETASEEESEAEKYYEVEKIVKARKRKGKREFLIKWKGYPESQNTWEPESNLNEYAKQYLRQNPGKFSR